MKATLPGGQVDNQCFSYDQLQQLTEAWTPNTATCDAGARSQSALAGPAPYWTSWATNTIGKTTSRTDRTPTTSSTTSYSYPSDGATATRPHFITGSTTTGSNPGTASYTADLAGNTTKRPAPGGGNQDLVWDELNQLTEVTKAGTTVAKMVYDAAGERILRQQGTTTTLYLAGSEITLNTATSTVSANRYYHHAGQTVAVRTGASNDTVTTLISDWQGTTHHQINNASGALSTSWQDPYGNPRGTPPTAWTGERGFVGGTKDATGLTRIGARDYDPILQRFITVDPIQDLTDPLQWNPYLYSNNTPITKADPTGELMCIDSCDWDRRRFSKAASKPKRKGPISLKGHTRGRNPYSDRAYTPSKGGKIGSRGKPNPSTTKTRKITFIMSGGGTISQTSTNGPAWTTDWDAGRDMIKEILGINDIQRCSKGDIGSCAWTLATILPIGKIAKIGKLGAMGAKAAKLVGSGPVPGVLEASSRVKSFGALRNYNPKGGVEYVFDPGSGTFAVGKPAASAGLRGSPHEQLAQSIGADPSTVVGGTLTRGSNGAFITTEYSGHYWQNWTPAIRQQFVDTMHGYGLDVVH